MNENIDLTKILKNCPEGWELYHAAYGRVWFYCIDLDFSFPIRLSLSKEIFDNIAVTSKGTINNYNGECLLFPSKEQRDWSKFTAPWYKKEEEKKFDPKTLQSFDKVLVRDSLNDTWRCSLFSHIIKNDNFPYKCVGNAFVYCIPYNDKTKHLVGTTDEAPEYYSYWED